MAELSEVQVELAAEAYWDSFRHNPSWKAAEEIKYKDKCRNGIRAAAPFLQFPWDEPNKIEMNELYGNHAHLMICKFVRRRNASLMPKPVDPRIDLIDKALCNFMNSLNNTEERTKAAQAIIAVLDEVK